MQTIDLHAWCFLSGRICALENHLLRKDFFERLLPPEEPVGAQQSGVAPPPVPLLTSLKETPLRDDFPTTEDVLNFEEILHQRFFRLLLEIKELSPTPWVWELLQARYDLINLKNFLKEKLIGLRRPIPFPGPCTDETWEALWGGHDLLCRDRALALSEMDRPEGLSLQEEQAGMYQTALKDIKGHLGEISEDPGILDLILDGTYLSSIPQLAERTASQFIMDYCLEYQKLMGILFSWRASTKGLLGYVPERIVNRGGVIPPLPGYEKAVEDTLMERLEAAKLFVFGPERVFGYLKGLETETLNLRLTIGGRLQGVPPEDIKQRLRKGYV